MNSINKFVMPWALLGLMITIVIAGVIGVFIGFNVAENQFQNEKIQLVRAQNAALAERDARMLEAEQRNVQLESQFLTSIQELASNYKALTAQMS